MAISSPSLPASLDSINDDDRAALVGAAAMGAPALVQALCELNPHLSGKDLSAACAALGRTVSKATASEWRKRLAAGLSIDTPNVPAEDGAGTVDQIRARLREASTTGSAQDVVRYANALARLQGLPTEAPTELDTADYSRLSDDEFRTLERLMAKARGEPEPSATAWPDPHPAHVPLAPLAVDGELTPEGRAVVADVVGGFVAARQARLERAGAAVSPGLGTTRV